MNFEIYIILISIIKATLGSFTALKLAEHFDVEKKERKNRWLLASAVMFGLGIWSMHFKGAFLLFEASQMQITYQPITFFLALIVSIIGTSVAFHLSFSQGRSLSKCFYSGTILAITVAVVFCLEIRSSTKSVVEYIPVNLVMLFVVALLLSTTAIYVFGLSMEKRMFPNMKMLSSLLIAVLFIGIDLSGIVLLDIEYGTLNSQTQSTIGNWMTWLVTFIFVTIMAIGLASSYWFQKKQSESFKLNQIKYRALFDENPSGIFTIDNKGSFIKLNEAATRITGYSEEEMLGDGFSRYIIEEERDKAWTNFNNSLVGGFLDFEIKCYHKQGHIITLLVNNIPMIVNEQVLGVYAVVKDITKEIKIEKELQEKDNLYQLVSEYMSEFVILIDKSGLMVYVSPSHKKELGYETDYLIGHSAFEWIHPDDIRKVEPLLTEIIHDKKKAKAIFRYRHFEGHYLYLESEATPIINEQGEIEHIVVSSRNVDERVKNELIIAESEKKFRLIAENSSDLIRLIDQNEIVTYASPSHHTILGYDQDEIVDKPFHAIVHPKDIGKVATKLTSDQMIVYRVRKKDGGYLWMEASISPLYDDEGERLQFAVVSRDISERKKYEEQLKKMAFYDPLTGIANRRMFHKLLLSEIEIATRNSFAVLYIDCDHFKWVNDTLGHDIGDELLIAFSMRVQACLNEGDVIGRLGGDEFGIILRNIHSVEQIERIIETLNRVLRVPWNIKGQEFSTTFSIGITTYDGMNQSIEDILTRADQALYQAKIAGKNTYRFFSEEMEAAFRRRVMLENDLRQAIMKNHFRLVYQPQVNLITNEIVGVEALIRYHHPTLGHVSPDEFIPICERIGLINELTKWVLSTALSDQKQWREHGVEIRVSVNVSPKNVESDFFVSYVNEMVDKYAVPFGALELELTEQAFLHQMDEARARLEKLRSKGIRIALDDFGAGYSSLLHVKDLPLDVLKVDRSFVAKVNEREKDIHILRGIFILGVMLGIEVVCEGIETKEQRKLLKDEGCEFAQGFFFYKPLEKPELEQLLYSLELESKLLD